MKKTSAAKSRELRPATDDILRRVVEEEALPTGGLGTEIADLFVEVGLKADIPELQGCVIKPFGCESRSI
jgi:uncharacterized phage-like protein YoqJ